MSRDLSPPNIPVPTFISKLRKGKSKCKYIFKLIWFSDLIDGFKHTKIFKCKNYLNSTDIN